MIDSIIGDIVGSIYEFSNIKTKEFPLFSKYCEFTDNSILTVATADWLLNGGDAAKYYSRYAANHDCPMGGYGSGFRLWVSRTVTDGDFSPYNSCGNGSAMRVGPVGWLSAMISLCVLKSCDHGIRGTDLMKQEMEEHAKEVFPRPSSVHSTPPTLKMLFEMR